MPLRCFSKCLDLSSRAGMASISNRVACAAVRQDSHDNKPQILVVAAARVVFICGWPPIRVETNCSQGSNLVKTNDSDKRTSPFHHRPTKNVSTPSRISFRLPPWNGFSKALHNTLEDVPFGSLIRKGAAWFSFGPTAESKGQRTAVARTGKMKPRGAVRSMEETTSDILTPE